MTSPSAGADRLLAQARFTEVDAAFLLDLRGWLEEPLRGYPPPLVRDVAVVLGELMTNAFRHARPPFAARLAVPRDSAVVRVEVHDGAACSAAGWPLGRGLLIVRDLCPDWGVEHRPDSKITWAEVVIPDNPARN